MLTKQVEEMKQFIAENEHKASGSSGHDQLDKRYESITYKKGEIIEMTGASS